MQNHADFVVFINSLEAPATFLQSFSSVWTACPPLPRGKEAPHYNLMQAELKHVLHFRLRNQRPSYNSQVAQAVVCER